MATPYATNNRYTNKFGGGVYDKLMNTVVEVPAGFAAENYVDKLNDDYDREVHADRVATSCFPEMSKELKLEYDAMVGFAKAVADRAQQALADLQVRYDSNPALQTPRTWHEHNARDQYRSEVAAVKQASKMAMAVLAGADKEVAKF